MKLSIRVAGIIVRDRSLLVHQAEGRAGIYYALPGGQLKAGESTPQCLMRELAEEFGIEVEVGRLLYLAEGWWNGGKAGQKEKQEIVFYYLATLSDPTIAIRSREEPRIYAAWLPLDGPLDQLWPSWLRQQLPLQYAAGWAGTAQHVIADERVTPSIPWAIRDLTA